MPSVVAVRFHETRKCPAGSFAWHPVLGLVDVLQARGWERVVRAARPLDAGRDLLDVDVRELESIELGGTLGIGFAYVADERELRALVEEDCAELGEARDWEPVPRRLAAPLLRD